MVSSEKTYPIKISVIVPLYNVENYMEKCISSILKQTFKSYEIILVNDGSPDNCGVIANSYEQNFHNIKVVHKENGGLSSARNAGMRVARGEYLFFVDSDDWIEPTLLEQTYNAIKNTNSQICVFNVLRKYENSNKSFVQAEKLEPIIDVKKLGGSNYIKSYMLNSKAHRYSAWNRLYEHNFLKQFNITFEPNTEIHSEDMLFNLQCSTFVTKVCTINTPLYVHLIRSGTISTSPKPQLTKKLMTLISRFIESTNKASNYNEIKQSIPEITQYCFFMSMGSEINLNKLTFKELRSVILGCYKFNFFQNSMKKMGRKINNKRNFISFLLGKKMAWLTTLILLIGLKTR